LTLLGGGACPGPGTHSKGATTRFAAINLANGDVVGRH
jgi:hypothetical protein